MKNCKTRKKIDFEKYGKREKQNRMRVNAV